ncbi:MAG: redox-regulated ATPase YchF [Spirochaetia bacterium]|jgi:GTP-binding protein YchF|nr:redox-regulated ATPase YchF [Spirochaetia bacterium]
MNIGIIGLPKSGKTTIFNALTGQNAEVTEYSSGKVEPNVAIVNVGDERVERLAEMYKPKKTIYATTEFIDFVSAASGASKQGGLFSSEGMTLVKTADALLIVLRNFSKESLDESFGAVNPEKDLETIQSELLLADQIITERRISRIEADHSRGKKTTQSQLEEKVMRRILSALEEGNWIQTIDFTAEELGVISGFRFLTAKQALIVLNSGEDNYGKNSTLLEKLGEKYPALEFAGNFEMELSQMSQEDADVFMADMGITSSARNRLTGFAYSLLGYISFFTVGEDEVRAWTIRKDDTALTAAGAIHSDLAKGFIRAECFSYDDLITYGSEKGLREKGHFRLEGKEYKVRDGDILNIRFNV